MKTRKTVIAVLIAALLVSAALIVGCMNQFEGISVKDAEDDYQIQEGKGIIKLKISDSKRTIMPTAFPIADMWFTITCTATAGGANVTFPTAGREQISGGNKNIPLTNGTYTVTVSAWDDYDAGDSSVGVPIAGYTQNGVIVNNASVNVNANLIGITDGADEGKFFYYILADDPVNGEFTTIDYTSKTLQIFKYGTATQVGGDIDIDTNDSGEITLDSGFYDVIVTLEANNCQDRVVDNILHIYPSMTSYYGVLIPPPAPVPVDAPIVIPAPVQNLFTVVYDLDGVTQSSSITLNQSVSNAASTTTPGSPTSLTHDFVRWVTTQGSSTPWGFGTTKIFKDTKIWAEWTAKAGANITITFNISDKGVINDASDDDGLGKFTYLLLSAETQQLKFTTTLTGAVWKLNNTPLASSQTVIAQDTITIDGSNNDTILDTLASGTHRISVTGKNGSDPEPYNAWIEFTINNQ